MSSSFLCSCGFSGDTNRALAVHTRRAHSALQLAEGGGDGGEGEEGGGERASAQWAAADDDAAGELRALAASAPLALRALLIPEKGLDYMRTADLRAAGGADGEEEPLDAEDDGDALEEALRREDEEAPALSDVSTHDTPLCFLTAVAADEVFTAEDADDGGEEESGGGGGGG